MDTRSFVMLLQFLTYAQQSIDINFLYQSVDVIQELDSKQRKIRSLRGFFLYALEIFDTKSRRFTLGNLYFGARAKI